MPRPPLEGITAWSLLKEARERIYTLPPDFPGFQAKLAFYWQGVWHWGEVEVQGFFPKAKLMEDVKPLAERELASILGHRRPIPFEQGEGRWPMRGLEDGPLGVRIALEDPFHSHLWVREGRLSLIQRRLEEGELRLHLLSWKETHDERLLPHRFVLVQKNARGEIHRVEIYRDEYTRVGPYWLPRERQVEVEGERLGSLMIRLEELEVRK
ncbi:DUF3386 family protein [Thermus aquaticus]|jgi:hypothetical protein|uniref:Uncharacterized protein n=1 Tax=Thermus aquaticus (strain ATCC BAA-2747 / Y51MC23) TaxID=498848 RepID=A0ABM5VQ98_THEA5|nr:DUF3386 family protein [Thermus aquaticus]ALJ92351.1 hypothetical protein TO73_2830 [Thermus aquaticus Y51MC23]